MKRTHIMIAVFFACILSPNLLFPILKTTTDEGTGENRSLAAFPTLSLETIDTFPSGVEDWINDHAAFRNRFLSLNARLNLSLFQFGDSQDVITGKDGWYFYTLGSSFDFDLSNTCAVQFLFQECSDVIVFHQVISKVFFCMVCNIQVTLYKCIIKVFIFFNLLMDMSDICELLFFQEKS